MECLAKSYYYRTCYNEDPYIDNDGDPINAKPSLFTNTQRFKRGSLAITLRSTSEQNSCNFHNTYIKDFQYKLMTREKFHKYWKKRSPRYMHALKKTMMKPIMAYQQAVDLGKLRI